MKLGARALLTFALITASFGTAFAASKQIVFSEILVKRVGANPTQDQLIELHNTGSSSINIGGWQFCHEFNYFAIPGGTTIPGNGILVVHFNQSGSSAGHLFIPGHTLSLSSDLALYTNSDFGNPSSMHAFIQFGAVVSGRQSVASAAGLWTINTFVPVPSTAGHSVELCDTNATSTAAWSPTANPTIGVMNGCGVAIEATSWGAVKALFRDSN